MKPGSRLSQETGSVLILAILLTALISALGILLAVGVSAELTVAGAHRTAEELLYACEAGAERALVDLFEADTWSPTLRGDVLSTFRVRVGALPDGSPLDLTLLTQALQRESDLRFSGRPDRPLWRLYAYGPLHALGEIGLAAPPAFVLVWVADDPDDGDAQPSTDSNDRILVRVEAREPTGGRRTVELLLGHRPAAGAPGTPAAAAARVLQWRHAR